MKFIMDEIKIFDLMQGFIGLTYTDGFSSFLAHVIFFAVIILAIIGLVTVIKAIPKLWKKKETPGEHWMRTGHMK